LSEGPTIGGPMLFGPYVADTFVWTASTGMKPATPKGLESLKPVSEGGKLVLPAGADCMQLVQTTATGLAIGYAGSSLDFHQCNPKTALMWQVDGTPIVIYQCDSRPSCESGLVDLNDTGEVIGYRPDGAFRWTRSAGLVRIPVANGAVRAINDNGDIAGAAVTNVVGVMKPLVWMASGEIKIIDLPSGATSGQATGINNKGQIIGVFR